MIFYQNESQFGPDQFILVVTKSYGQVQINLVRPKPFGTDQNCFGHIEGQGITLKSQTNEYTLKPKNTT